MPVQFKPAERDPVHQAFIDALKRALDDPDTMEGKVTLIQELHWWDRYRKEKWIGRKERERRDAEYERILRGVRAYDRLIGLIEEQAGQSDG